MSAAPSIDELEQAIVRLAGDLERRIARWLPLLAEFDRREGARHWGFRSTAEWLAWRCAIEARTAREHVRVARRLSELPLMHAAFAEGGLSYSKLRAVTRAAASEDEAALLALAQRSTAAELEREVRALRSAPSAGVDLANAVHERRYVEWAWEPDGSLRISGRLSPDDGAALIEALEAGAEALHPPGAPTPGRPPLGARRADALTELAMSGAPRVQVVLHVDAPALACTAREAGERAGEVCALEDGPALPSETARRLACDAEVIETTPAAARDLGRRRRVVSPPLRTALERRDRSCRFPGCARRHGLHAHHVVHWAHGGGTDRSNLVLLCRFHHRLVHEEGFTVAGDERGWRFLRPDGRVVPRAPALPERAPPLELAA